jgi:hypothetical protein
MSDASISIENHLIELDVGKTSKYREAVAMILDSDISPVFPRWATVMIIR